MQLHNRSTMADEEKVKSTDKLLQALDALSQLNQARVTRRSNSLPLTRSGSASKDGSDAGTGDPAGEEASRPRPRVSPRLSPTLPIWSKPNNKLDKNDEKAEEGDDSALIIIIKPRHRLSLMLPFRARSKMIKEHDDDYDDYDDYDEDDDDDSAMLKILGADGEKKKGITYHGPIRVTSRIGLRRMSCLFSVEVVAVQGLPPAMNGLRLVVAVRRKETREGAVRTMPARVRLGAADFDEVLCVRCSLYGAGATSRPVNFEPRPFVLSLVAVDAPEMDLGRSAVDLGLFAKEFMEKRSRQWDMVFPLASKAKGGELIIKLAIQSIDDDGSVEWGSQPDSEDKTTSYASLSSSIKRSLVSTGRKHRVVPRKIRRSSITNTLTTVKTDMPAPDLRGIDSFKLDEPEPKPELTPIDEVKETQEKELECNPADKPTPLAELEEEQRKELECELTDESTSVTEVEEEELQTESEKESTDEPSVIVEVEKDEQKEPECETTNEPNSVGEVEEEQRQQKELECEPCDVSSPLTEIEEEEEEEEEEQKELECEPSDEPTPLIEMEEEEQKELDRCELSNEPTPLTEMEEEEEQKELECKPSDEPSPLIEVEEMEEEQKELECEPSDEPTTIDEVKEQEQQQELECEPTDEHTPMVEVEEEEEEQQTTLERELADDPTPITEMKEEEQQKESAHDPADEPTPVAEMNKEEQHQEPKLELEEAQEDNYLELSESDMTDKRDEGQVKVELEEWAKVKKGSEEEGEEEQEEDALVAGDGVVKVMANGLEEMSLEATMSSHVSDVVANNVMEPMNGETARPKEVNGEYLQGTEQGKDKGAAIKPGQRRFKWRTVALLVPLAILNSKTLGARR